jgi:hypothetical protein
MFFHDEYTTTGARLEELTELGRMHGYENPGPIVAYPPNVGHFNQNLSPGILPAGIKLYVPYSQALLLKTAVTHEYLASATTQQLQRLLATPSVDRKELESFLFKIDAINFLGSFTTAIGGSAVAARAGKNLVTSSKDLAKWLMQDRMTTATNLTTMVLPQPEKPRKDFNFFVRHAFGAWNPSYWASVYASIAEADVDIWLHGSSAIEFAEKLRWKVNLEKDIERSKLTARHARLQIAMPFYGHLV